jgi:hypothetical protein
LGRWFECMDDATTCLKLRPDWFKVPLSRSTHAHTHSLSHSVLTEYGRQQMMSTKQTPCMVKTSGKKTADDASAAQKQL